MSVYRPVLYSFRRCPYAIRARYALVTSGLDYEHREILLKAKPQAMLEASPKGTVPVLVLPGGQVIDESLDVMTWALGKNDPDSWLSHRTEAAQELVEQNDGPFKAALDRYKYFQRHPEATQSDYRHEGETFLQQLEDALADFSGEGLVAPRTTFADVAIFPFIRQFSKVEPEWFATSPYPLLRAWLDCFLESERMARVMRKHALWDPGASS